MEKPFPLAPALTPVTGPLTQGIHNMDFKAKNVSPLAPTIIDTPSVASTILCTDAEKGLLIPPTSSSAALQLFSSDTINQHQEPSNNQRKPPEAVVESPPGQPNWETLQEATARLLFMAIKWVKCLAPFQSLTLSDQVGFFPFLLGLLSFIKLL